MLERAMQIAYCTFRRDEDIELAPNAATYGGARALGREPYGAAPGAPDYLVVVAARIAAEAATDSTYDVGRASDGVADESPAGSRDGERSPFRAMRLHPVAAAP